MPFVDSILEARSPRPQRHGLGYSQGAVYASPRRFPTLPRNRSISRASAVRVTCRDDIFGRQAFRAESQNQGLRSILPSTALTRP
jgi:hypothetical protein